MLSKKMTVSLTSLIIVIAMTFIVALSAEARFDVTLSIKDADLVTADDQGDKGTEDGIQVQTSDGTAANVVLKIAAGDEVLVTPPNTNDIVIIGGTLGTLTRDGKGLMGTLTPTTGVTEMSVYVRPNALSTASGNTGHDAESLILKYVLHDVAAPKVIGIVRPSVERALDTATPIEADHPVIEDMFTLLITLSEKAKAFTTDHVTASNAKVERVYLLRSVVDAENTDPAQKNAEYTGNYTGTDNKHYIYVATVKPNYAKTDDIKVTIKKFEDMFGNASADPAQKENPVIKVDPSRVKKTATAAGLKITIPNDILVPAGGYLVIAKDDGSGTSDEDRTSSTQIVYPGPSNQTEAEIKLRQESKQKYNLIKADLPNLETYLTSGVTIDVTSDLLTVSEIMWGADASLGNPAHNQWIELHNASDKFYKTKDDTLTFYSFNETVPPKTAAVAATATTAAKPAALPSGVSDRIGTVTDTKGFWSIVGRGQSGRTGQGETAGELVAVVPTAKVYSMYRVMVPSTAVGAAPGAMMPEEGNTAAAWMQSPEPGVNFRSSATGIRVGSPGADTLRFTVPPAVVEEPAPVVIPGATATDIMITEIMVDTGDGRLPQWIELTNVSEKEVSLKDWALLISNAAADADVEGGSLEIDLSAYTLGVRATPNATGNNGQSLLLVGGTARTSGNLAGNDRVVNITSALGAQGRYTFLSPMGFMIKLLPPQTTGVLAYGDTAGNLGAAVAWDIEMDETGRSSLIRLNDATGMVMDGTAENGWKLASSTSLVDGPATWVGSDEDAGTPGYDSGGPLPVELSHFRPARDKATGQVVITWATQSELNNAGFFIKRAQQRDGEFKVINATMIAGAGTTSEKQFYTFTDTTAQPNIVYYYQIEDVSLDGQRQTLTRGIRLKGHIGAAGKLTATWGELKSSNE